MSAPAKKLREVLVEWAVGKDSYRLVAIADKTPGYRDRYVIDRLGTCSLGEPSWTPAESWVAHTRGSRVTVTDHLTRAIESMLADRAARVNMASLDFASYFGNPPPVPPVTNNWPEVRRGNDLDQLSPAERAACLGENLGPAGTHCSVCDEPQYKTRSGDTCANGHGGAPSSYEKDHR